MENILSKFNKSLNPYRGLSKEIYIIALGRIINCAGSFVFPLLTLILTKKLKMDTSHAGIIISISGIISMFSSIIGGKLTDLWGRKKIIVLFSTLGALCYMVCSFIGISIKIIPFIIAASFIYGLSGPASDALVADITTPKNRDSAYSLFYMSINVGFAVSPIIGGLLFEKYLRILFIADSVTTLISTLLIMIYIPETITKTHEKLGKDRIMEERVEGSIFKVLMERPVLIFYALVMFGYEFVYSQWGFMYPIQAEKIIPGSGAKFYGTLMSFNAIIVVTLTPLITKLLLKKNSLRKIFYGGILYMISFGLPGFIANVPFMYTAVLILTLGEIIVTTSSSPFVANRTPASHRGRMNAILPLIIGFGFTIGPLITGKLIIIAGIKNTWRIVGFIMAVFSILDLILERYDERTSVQREAAFGNNNI